MAKQISSDKKPLFKLEGQEHEKPRKQFRYSDIIKAYDNVDLTKIKEFASSLSKDWQNILDDYENTNMKLGNKIIHRTVGLPQGGKLSPILFNFYLDNVLSNVDISQDYIYADNLALFGTKINDLNTKQNEYTLALQKGGFSIEEWDTWNFKKSNLISHKKDMENIQSRVKQTDYFNSDIPKSDHESKRILGFNLSIKDDIIDINAKDVDTNFKIKKYPPYKAINKYKQLIEPKFMHQAKHIIDFNIDKIRRKYLMKMMAIIVIPSKYFNGNFNNPTYWNKFLSLYFNERVYQEDDIIIPPQHNSIWFNRLLKLCSIMKSYYIPDYQMIRFIYLGRCRLIALNKIDTKIIKHNAKLLDYGWFIISGNWSYATALMMLQLKVLDKLDKKINKYSKFTSNLNIPKNIYY